MLYFRNLLDYVVVYIEAAGLRTSRVRSWDQSPTQRHGCCSIPVQCQTGTYGGMAGVDNSHTGSALFAHTQQKIIQQWTPLPEGKTTSIFCYTFSPSGFSLLFLIFFDVATILAEVSDLNVCDNIDRRVGIYAGRKRRLAEMRTGIS